MAVQLEQEIMMAIGLGNHYSWYNGSGSCGYIAREAIGLLPKAIQKAVDDNKEIAHITLVICEGAPIRILKYNHFGSQV